MMIIHVGDKASIPEVTPDVGSNSEMRPTIVLFSIQTNFLMVSSIQLRIIENSRGCMVQPSQTPRVPRNVHP